MIAVKTRCEVGSLDPGQTGGHAMLAENPVLAERARAVMPEIALLGPESDPITASSPNSGDDGPRLLADGMDLSARPVCPSTLERSRSGDFTKALPGQDPRKVVNNPSAERCADVIRRGPSSSFDKIDKQVFA